MGKTKTLKRHGASSRKPKKDLELDDFQGIKKLDALHELADANQTSLAIFECLLNNDPEGAMEMIEIYLDAANKSKIRRHIHMSKSTMYSALKHRNPTIKTLAKIMHASVNG